ncbi:hypothetical protein CLU79DRAFT_738667 [Phycomyces nitens]|nr:hypothetical protein CLU79DRAFT_738667 [Phycomyces nitens]
MSHLYPRRSPSEEHLEDPDFEEFYEHSPVKDHYRYSPQYRSNPAGPRQPAVFESPPLRRLHIQHPGYRPQFRSQPSYLEDQFYDYEDQEQHMFPDHPQPYTPSTHLYYPGDSPRLNRQSPPHYGHHEPPAGWRPSPVRYFYDDNDAEEAVQRFQSRRQPVQQYPGHMSPGYFASPLSPSYSSPTRKSRTARQDYYGSDGEYSEDRQRPTFYRDPRPRSHRRSRSVSSSTSLPLPQRVREEAETEVGDEDEDQQDPDSRLVSARKPKPEPATQPSSRTSQDSKKGQRNLTPILRRRPTEESISQPTQITGDGEFRRHSMTDPAPSGSEPSSPMMHGQPQVIQRPSYIPIDSGMGMNMSAPNSPWIQPQFNMPQPTYFNPPLQPLPHNQFILPHFQQPPPPPPPPMMPMTMPMPMPMPMPWNDFSNPVTPYPMPFMPYTHPINPAQNPAIPATSAPSDLVVKDPKDKSEPEKKDKPEPEKKDSEAPPKPTLSRSVSLSGVPVQRQRSFFGSLFGSSGSGKAGESGKGPSLWDPVSAYVPIQDVLKQEKSVATANSIQSALTSNQLSRKASRVLTQKAKELEKRDNIWCYRPKETKLQETQKVWVPFDLRNQIKLDKYMQNVAPPALKTVTAPLEIKDSKLPGNLLVLPHQGVAYHYKSMMSTKYMVLEIVSIPSNGEGNQLVVRQSDIPINAVDAAPVSKPTGNLWTSVFK